MKSRTAMKLLQACLRSLFLLLALFVIFCLALAVQAAPAAKVVKQHRPIAKPSHLIVKPVIKPIVKIGQPYRAERLHPKPPAFLYYNGIYLSWRDSVRFDRLKKIKHP